MARNIDDFADMLHRACRPDPAEGPSARHQPTPKDLARVLHQAVLSIKSGYGLAAVLILAGAIWLPLPGSQAARQAPVAEASLATPVPSQLVGQLALAVSPDTAGADEPNADKRGATTASGPTAAAVRLPAQTAENRRVDSSLRREARAPTPGAADRALPQQPPPAPSAEPAAEPKLAAVTPPPRAPRDEPAWLRFAVPAALAEGRPRIAVVIDDLGLDRKRTERAMVLPGPLTFSFLAYATDLPQLSAAARRAGHELLVSVPMEPMSRAVDMGPNGLTVGLAHDELLRRLRWNLDRFTGYVGIINHMGSRFTHDAASMAPVVEELRARGLLLVDSRTVGNSAGVDVARRLGVPHAARDVFLDNEVTAGAIAAQLAEVERIARRHGSAIAIGHARDATIEQLDAWLASLPGKGLALVPVSTIVREHWHGGDAATN